MSGILGCVDCKKNCATKIATYFAEHREKRRYYENHPQEVDDILAEGIHKAKIVAHTTMQEVHEAMNMG